MRCGFSLLSGFRRRRWVHTECVLDTLVVKNHLMRAEVHDGPVLAQEI